MILMSWRVSKGKVIREGDVVEQSNFEIRVPTMDRMVVSSGPNSIFPVL